MQISASVLRMHAACITSPLKAPVSAWSNTRRFAAHRNSRTFLHTVHAAQQRAAGEDPSNVEVKGTSTHARLPTHSRGVAHVPTKRCVRLCKQRSSVFLRHTQSGIACQHMHAILQRLTLQSRKVKVLLSNQLTIHLMPTSARVIKRLRTLSSKQDRATLVQKVRVSNAVVASGRKHALLVFWMLF